MTMMAELTRKSHRVFVRDPQARGTGIREIVPALTHFRPMIPMASAGVPNQVNKAARPLLPKLMGGFIAALK